MADEIKDVKSVSELTGDAAKVLLEKDNEKVVNDDEKLSETNDTKISIIDKIKNLIKSKKDDSSQDDSDKEDLTDSKKHSGDVPEAFVSAATKAGWSEEQIAEFASDYSDEELLEHIKYIVEPSEKPDLEQDDSHQKDGKDDKKKDDNKDGSDKDDKDVLIQELRDRITKLEEANKKDSEEKESEAEVKKALRATEVLDKLSETFPVFGVFEKGKSNSLPRFPNGTIIPNSPQNIARNQVWHTALKLEKAGEDFESALSIAIDAFKGANLEKDVKRNLIKSLKRSEKKLSPKHSSHEAVEKPKRGSDVVKQVMDKYGNKTND